MLGDFKEFTFKELPPASKQALLDNALNALKKEFAETSQAPQDLPGMQKILVTADSPTFLEEAAKLLAEQVKERFSPKELIVSDVGVSCGASIRPGLCAVFYKGAPASTGLEKEKAIMDQICAQIKST